MGVTHKLADSLHYVLLYPNGENECSIDLPKYTVKKKRNGSYQYIVILPNSVHRWHVSMREFYNYLQWEREGIYNSVTVC